MPGTQIDIQEDLETGPGQYPETARPGRKVRGWKRNAGHVQGWGRRNVNTASDCCPSRQPGYDGRLARPGAGRLQAVPDTYDRGNSLRRKVRKKAGKTGEDQGEITLSRSFQTQPSL